MKLGDEIVRDIVVDIMGDIVGVNKIGGNDVHERSSPKARSQIECKFRSRERNDLLIISDDECSLTPIITGTNVEVDPSFFLCLQRISLSGSVKVGESPSCVYPSTCLHVTLSVWLCLILYIYIKLSVCLCMSVFYVF